jgi:hypothetical protein
MSVNTETLIGFVKDLFEPSQLLHTYESFCNIYDHLEDGGIFSIKKTMYLDDKKHSLFYNYLHTLKKTNFIVRGYLDKASNSFLILGFKNKIKNKKQLLKFEQYLKSQNGQIIENIPITIKPKIIDNNHLFLGGILYYILDKSFLVKSIIAIIIFFIFVLIIMAIIFPNEKVKAKRKNVKIKSFFVGINFILVENLLIIKLRFLTPNPLDAYYYGLLLFTLGAIIGNLFYEKYQNKKYQNKKYYIINSILFYSFGISSLLMYLHIVFILPTILLTGIFFKELLIKYKNKSLLIFSYDMLGMMFGGIISLIFLYSVNLLYLFHFTIITFIITLCLMRADIMSFYSIKTKV